MKRSRQARLSPHEWLLFGLVFGLFVSALWMRSARQPLPPRAEPLVLEPLPQGAEVRAGLYGEPPAPVRAGADLR